MSNQSRRSTRNLYPIALATMLCLAAVDRAHAAETITATAQVKSSGGVAASAPVRAVVDRFSTDSERDELLATLKQTGTTGARKLLGTRKQLGSLQVGASNTPIKYAYERATGDGRLITIVTDSPIVFVGAGLPGAAPKTGFDLGLVMLEVATSGAGRGELVPATKVRVNEQGAIVTEDYSAEVIQLSNVMGKSGGR